MMTNKLNSPCKDCTDRAMGCHGKCDKYKAYRVEVDKLYAVKAASIKAHDPMYGYIRASRTKQLHEEARRKR